MFRDNLVVEAGFMTQRKEADRDETLNEIAHRLQYSNPATTSGMSL